jgi:hypothetical protein
MQECGVAEQVFEGARDIRIDPEPCRESSIFGVRPASGARETLQARFPGPATKNGSAQPRSYDDDIFLCLTWRRVDVNDRAVLQNASEPKPT